MNGPAIEIENLTKDYPTGFLEMSRIRSLDGLTMQVASGEVFGFLGPNGAGKSTTIKLLMGIIFPTGGTARILGRPINDVQMHHGIGYLPEHPYFYDYLTGAELLDYFARFHRMASTMRRSRVQEMLKRVGLEAAGKIQLRKYSKGMLQRVGLAQAILHDPQVIILDEPMSGLDPIGRREVRDIILELRQQTKTVFFSTHILSDAEVLCDRVGVLVGGKLKGVGTPDEIVCVESQGIEILFECKVREGTALPIFTKATPSGSRYRLQVPENELYPSLDALRLAGASIVSVTQIKPTLEDYFMNQVAASRTQAAVEVSGK